MKQYKCKICDRFFDSLKGRASHHKKHPEIKQDVENNNIELQKLICNSDIKCLCGKKFIENSQFHGHRAKCNIYKEKLSEFYESKKDQIMEDYKTISLYNLENKLKQERPDLFISRYLLKTTLSSWGCTHKTLKEVANLESTRNNFKKTCVEKYGTTNPLSNGSRSKEKRDQTVKEKYGVNNVFQRQDIRTKINSEEFYLEKYGKNKFDVLSERAKKAWINPNNINKRIGTSILISSLEIKVEKFLEDLGISFQKQFYLYSEDKNTLFFYDFKVNNVLIEVQGRYWHADPRYYSSDQKINYPGRNKIDVKSASEIWQKDLNKKIFAEKFGYEVLYIWEDDINKYAQNVITLLKERFLNENQEY